MASQSLSEPCGMRVRDRGQPGLVGEQPADGDVALAGGRELGPVGGHRRVEVDEAPGDRPHRRDRDHALRAREHADEAVALPRPRACRVEVAAPEVDDVAAVDADRERRAQLEPVGEVLTRTRRAPPTNAGVARALDPVPSQDLGRLAGCGTPASARSCRRGSGTPRCTGCGTRCRCGRRRPRSGTPRRARRDRGTRAPRRARARTSVNSSNVMSCIWFHGSQALDRVRAGSRARRGGRTRGRRSRELASSSNSPAEIVASTVRTIVSVGCPSLRRRSTVIPLRCR